MCELTLLLGYALRRKQQHLIPSWIIYLRASPKARQQGKKHLYNDTKYTQVHLDTGGYSGGGVAEAIARV